MRGGSSQTYPSFPEIAASLGYNPARFLNHEDSAPIGDTSELALAKARINGITDINTIQAWLAVETDLDRGPRQTVVKWLNQRQAALQDTEPQADESASEHDSSPADTARALPEKTPTTEIASSEREEETATTETATTTNGTAADEPEPVSDPTCATCGEDLSPQEIAGQLGYWCPTCCDFREPATTASPAATTDHGEPALAADGGATEPSTTPICPDCRGELTREEAGDEVAFWCSPCGGFKEPLREEPSTEATA